ncbi:P2Y purinoceptor 3-like [Mustelus asterias]
MYEGRILEFGNSSQLIVPVRFLCPLHENYKHILLPITYSVVFILGLLSNGTVLWLSCCQTRTWSCSTIYLTNLAVADLLYVLSLPLLIVNYIWKDKWSFGDILCKQVRFCFYANLYGSIMFLTCTSIHRYVGVCFPMKSLRWRTRKLAIMGSIAAWFIVIMEALPTCIYAHAEALHNKTVCFDLTSPENFFSYLPYGVMLTVTGFLIPFTIITLCYCSILKTLATPGDNPLVRKPRRTKSICTILVVCALLVICFVPFHVTRLLYLFIRAYMVQNCGTLQSVSVLYKICRALLSFNSCINPILYFLSGRKSCSWLLRKNKVAPAFIRSQCPAWGNAAPGCPLASNRIPG